MASLNKVMIIGNLGRDPEIRFMPPRDGQEQGSAVATLNVATSRRYRGADGQYKEETEWHRIVFFGRTAEVAQQYLRKGSSVYVEGRLRTRKWTDQNNMERYTTEIIGDTMQMLGKRGEFADTPDAPFDMPAGAAPAPASGGFDQPRARPASNGFDQPRQRPSAPAAAPAAPAPASAGAALNSGLGDLEEDIPF